MHFRRNRAISERETFGAGWGPNPKAEVRECDAEDTPGKDKQEPGLAHVTELAERASCLAGSVSWVRMRS